MKSGLNVYIRNARCFHGLLVQYKLSALSCQQCSSWGYSLATLLAKLIYVPHLHVRIRWDIVFVATGLKLLKRSATCTVCNFCFCAQPNCTAWYRNYSITNFCWADSSLNLNPTDLHLSYLQTVIRLKVMVSHITY